MPVAPCVDWPVSRGARTRTRPANPPCANGASHNTRGASLLPLCALADASAPTRPHVSLAHHTRAPDAPRRATPGDATLFQHRLLCVSSFSGQRFSTHKHQPKASCGKSFSHSSSISPLAPAALLQGLIEDSAILRDDFDATHCIPTPYIFDDILFPHSLSTSLLFSFSAAPTVQSSRICILIIHGIQRGIYAKEILVA